MIYLFNNMMFNIICIICKYNMILCLKYVSLLAVMLVSSLDRKNVCILKRLKPYENATAYSTEDGF